MFPRSHLRFLLMGDCSIIMFP